MKANELLLLTYGLTHLVQTVQANMAATLTTCALLVCLVMVCKAGDK